VATTFSVAVVRMAATGARVSRSILPPTVVFVYKFRRMPL